MEQITKKRNNIYSLQIDEMNEFMVCEKDNNYIIKKQFKIENIEYTFAYIYLLIEVPFITILNEIIIEQLLFHWEINDKQWKFKLKYKNEMGNYTFIYEYEQLLQRNHYILLDWNCISYHYMKNMGAIKLLIDILILDKQMIFPNNSHQKIGKDDKYESK